MSLTLSSSSPLQRGLNRAGPLWTPPLYSLSAPKREPRTNLPARCLLDSSNAGFTLVELLIVIVVLGILAAIVVPRYTAVREDAYLTTVKSDLRILANQQAHYQATTQVYADDAALLTDLVPSEGVIISINEANEGMGWAATAYHQAMAGRTCGIYYGDASASNATPATSAGVVSCQE